MSALRIAIAALGFLGAIFFPPWIPVICIILLSLRFRAWEAIFIGLLVDLLWRAPEAGWQIVPFFTIGAIIIVWALEPLRREFLTA